MKTQTRPELSTRIMAIMHCDPERRPMPVWEIARRLWLNWRTEADRVPAEAGQIVLRVLQRMQRDRLVERSPAGWNIATYREAPMKWHCKGNEPKYIRYERPEGSFCHVAVFVADGKFPLVVMAEPKDNEGISVTNAVERIAKAVCNDYRLYLPMVYFVETYPWLAVRVRRPSCLGGEDQITPIATWQNVTFSIEKGREFHKTQDWQQAFTIHTPAWRHMDEGDWKALKIEPGTVQAAMGLEP